MAQDLLERLRDDLADLESKLAALTAQARSLRATLDVLDERLSGVDPGSRLVPDGNEAVLRVLGEESSQGMTLQEIIEALDRRNWLPPAERVTDAVRVTLTRLVRNGTIERDDRSYRIAQAAADAVRDSGRGPLG